MFVSENIKAKNWVGFYFKRMHYDILDCLKQKIPSPVVNFLVEPLQIILF